MILVTFVLRRYNAELQTSEMFNTAGRTVKSGLVGSAVVSSWTWAATLLQSTVSLVVLTHPPKRGRAARRKQNIVEANCNGLIGHLLPLWCLGSLLVRVRCYRA